jgi:hypothetical protein
MTRLYSVEPRGIGTVEVESLSSYVVRMASTHCASIGLLFAAVESGKGGEDAAWIRTLPQIPVATLIRPNGTTRSLVEALHRSTGVPISVLTSMTFLSIEQALRRSSNVFASHLRWCRECLREWSAQGATPYLKLAWLLTDVTTCHIHHCEIVGTCAICDRRQSGHDLWPSVAICLYCGSPLSAAKPDEIRVQSWHPAAPELLSLIQFIAANPEIIFPAAGAHRVTSSLYNEALRAGHWEDFARSLPRCVYPKLIQHPNHPLTLGTVVELARALRMPLTDVLLGRVKETNVILPLRERALAAGVEMKRRRRLGTREDMLAKVNAYLQQCPADRRPSLRATAMHLGISVGGLQHLLPAVAKEIVRANKQSRETQASEASRRLKDRVAQMVPRWGFPVSRKAMLRDLITENQWSKNAIRAAIAFELDGERIT